MGNSQIPDFVAETAATCAKCGQSVGPVVFSPFVPVTVLWRCLCGKLYEIIPPTC